MLVKAPSDVGDSGKEGSVGGMVRGKSMLGRVMGKRGREERKEKALKNFGSGAKKGNGAKRGRVRGGFAGFSDREDEGMLPDSREVTVLDREGEKGG